MSKGNTFENELLEHIFNNATLPLIGDATGLLASAADGSLYVSLHIADPGEAGTQTTSETSYAGYARVAVTRDGTGWTVATGSVVNAADIVFPECTSGTSTITHFGVGTASSSTGKILYTGTLTASLAVSANVTPRFQAGDLTITED